ncbi:MAG: nuclear transport factor 2 family protein [Pseudomonadota bacterium]
MQTPLPTPLDRYVAAQNAHDIPGLVACFSPDGHVYDEGKLHFGPGQIWVWATETTARYDITMSPLSLTTDADRAALVSTVSGNFPGSPLDLTFNFTLEAGHVRILEITQ